MSEFQDVLEAVAVTTDASAPNFDNILMGKFYMQGVDNAYDANTGTCNPECFNYKAVRNFLKLSAFIISSKWRFLQMMYHDNKAVGCSRVECQEIDAIGKKPGFVTVCHFGAATKYDYKGKAYNAGKQCVDADCPPDQSMCNAAKLCDGKYSFYGDLEGKT